MKYRLFLLGLLALLYGCGQTGPLYLPEATKQESASVSKQGE